MRLIDADALADALFDQRKNYPQWMADTIGNMPDAVARCRDCVNRYDPINCKMYSEGMDTSDEWFCADGKSKEESGEVNE